VSLAPLIETVGEACVVGSPVSDEVEVERDVGDKSVSVVAPGFA
jgi:hypothetical protein